VRQLAVRTTGIDHAARVATRTDEVGEARSLTGRWLGRARRSGCRRSGRLIGRRVLSVVDGWLCTVPIPLEVRETMPIRDTPWPNGTPCWTDLAVPDIAAATQFYSAVIGWSFVDSGEDFGHYNVAQTNGRAAAAIGPLQQEGQPSVWTIYLASDDADATAKLVGENGGRVLVEPMDIPGTGRMCIALDAAGGTFGVWQAAGVIGAEIYNEAGSMVWEDARLADPAAGKRFYSAVFGYTYAPVEGTPDDYETFSVNGEVAGGMGGMMGAPEGTPSHWMPYFSVPDVDAAVAAAERGGGTVTMPPMDTPYGLMSGLVDPFGAVFSLHGEVSGQ
jgi:predicted enzyme related to lactoylglutathione lyase